MTTLRWTRIICCLAVCPAPVLPARAASGDAPAAPAEDLKIKPPLPVWPSDLETITSDRPTFHFNGRYGATAYRIELATDPAFSRPITIDRFTVVDNTGIAPIVVAPYTGQALSEGQYYWRVFCSDDTGFTTPAANYRTFFVAREDRDAVIPPAESVHPRLLVRESELAGLHARLRRSPHLQRGWQYQYNAAVSALDLDPPKEEYAKAGVGQHGDYSTCAVWYLRHLENVAFVAFVTGDQRFARKGVEMLMTACGYERWLGPLFDNRQHFDPPWNATLETAMMVEALAVGYDLLYHQLAPEQRATVREALAEKGIRTLVQEWADPFGSSRLPRHQTPTGNWVMVCSASAGIGALALLGEHPEAPQWTRLVRNRVRAWLNDRGGDYYVDNPNPPNRPDPIPVIGPSEPNFGIDGGYKESISYMNYGTRYVCFFADALRGMTGENIFPHVPDKLLDPLAWNLMAWHTPDGLKSWTVDFGDCWGGTAWYADLLAALIKNRRDTRSSWIYRRIVPVPTTPRALLWYDNDLLESPPDTSVPMGVFRTIGQVVMRSGWSPETPMAAIKFHQNRGHFDIGTFYLFGGGHPTIIDSGPAAYTSSIYTGYSYRSAAHNVILVDDQQQTRTDGRMLAAVGTSRITAAAGELAAAYPQALQSWTRDLLMLPKGVAVVFDRVEGKGEHRFDLVLHPESPFTLRAPGELVIGEKPATTLTVHSEGKFTPVECDGYHMTLPRKYVRFNSDAPAGRQSFLTVCRWPDRSSGKGADVEVKAGEPGQWRLDHVEGKAWLAVRAGGLDDQRIAADARVVAVWDDGMRMPRRHAIMLDGKSLRVDGCDMIRSTHSINAAFESGVPLQASFWSDTAARVTLVADPSLHEFSLNGQAIDVQWSGDTISFDIPTGRSKLVGDELSRLPHSMPPLVLDDLPAISVPDDAPAYRPRVVTRSSTSYTDGIDAIDGDANTAWLALPGMPMPQWLEVELPRPEPMGRVFVSTNVPTKGKVEVWDVGIQAWTLRGQFETTATTPSATVIGEPVESSRIRVTVDWIDPANSFVQISTLKWESGR